MCEGDKEWTYYSCILLLLIKTECATVLENKIKAYYTQLRLSYVFTSLRIHDPISGSGKTLLQGPTPISIDVILYVFLAVFHL